MDRILSQAFKVEKIETLENEVNSMVLQINEKKDNNIKLENPILVEFSKKYKPEELTADGIPTIETQLRELKEKDEEQQIKDEEEKDKKYKREMIQRVKCLSLNKMGKDFMTNTFEMNVKDRNKLQEIMWTYNDIDPQEIINEFNEMVCDVLDDVKNTDYSKLPIYNY